MDVTQTLNAITYAIDAPGELLSCHHGNRSVSVDTSQDRKFEAMEEMLHDAYGCAVCDVFAEESDEQFWILLLHTGYGTVRLYHGGRKRGDCIAELAQSARKGCKFHNGGSVPSLLCEWTSGTFIQINRL
jgi:hypothetical protein